MDFPRDFLCTQTGELIFASHGIKPLEILQNELGVNAAVLNSGDIKIVGGYEVS